MKNTHTIDTALLKSMTVLYRRLKTGKTYEEFYQAWLPPGANTDRQDKNIIGKYFGFPENSGCVIHARNSIDPQQIISIGLVSATPAEVDRVAQEHTTSNQQRHEKINTVANKVGETEFFEIVDIIF